METRWARRAALVSHFAGVDSEWLMLAPVLVAFGLIPITLLLGFSRDARSPHRRLVATRNPGSPAT